MPHRFINKDILIGLEDLSKEGIKVKMGFLDPPYNIGFKYSDQVDDNLPWEKYADFMGDTFEKLKPVLEKNGSVFLVHYPESCARLLPVIEAKGFRLHQALFFVFSSPC